MKPPNIELWDMSRMLIGDTPWIFLAEVLLRIALLYTALVLAMRLMGRRLATKMTGNELLALVSLAGAVGPAVQAPDRGILSPLLVVIIVVVLQRSMAIGTFYRPAIEHWLQGQPTVLFVDGHLSLKTMLANAISREQLFAQLRGAGIEHLGQVERIYLEPDGSFTILRSSKSTPGLTVIPAWDTEMQEAQPATDKLVCDRCGSEGVTTVPCRCPACGGSHWVPAVLT